MKKIKDKNNFSVNIMSFLKRILNFEIVLILLLMIIIFIRVFLLVRSLIP